MIRSILFVHEIPIKDVKANLIQTLNMCYAFSKKGIKVKLLILIQVPKEQAISNVNNIIPNYSNSFEVEFIDYKPKLSFFSSFDRFSNLKKHIDFNYHYVFTRSPLVSIFVTKRKKSLIYEAHNAYYTKQKFLDKYYRFKFKKIIKKDSFQLFISISENLKQYWLANNISQSKSIALHDGATLDDRIVVPKNEFLFNDQSKLKVVYTGSLYEDRGIDRLLKLAKDFPNVNFLVVGGPDKNAELFRNKAKADSVSNILFTGYVDHEYVSYYLSNADVLLALWSRSVPTIDYCSPLKIFEYMNSNKLIIADGFITIKEVLSDNKNAILCNPDEYDSLKKALSDVINNPEKLNIGKDNKELIMSKYSWEKRTELILEKLYG
jgi:glycosyltransferase involved in cell wall biosynthesis